jgi:hypothetical protein
MGHTFYGKNGKTFDRNVAAGNFLAKITVGLWDTIGCYPKTDEDCKLVARILRNRISINEHWRDYFKEMWDIKKEPLESLEWMEEMADFFENCGGCLEDG